MKKIFIALLLVLSSLAYGQLPKVPMNVGTRLNVAFPIVNLAIDAINGAVSITDYLNQMATLDSLRVLSSPPSSGNIYISSEDNNIHYYVNGYWRTLGVADSTESSGPASSLLTGLQAFYKFDESSGNITDHSGNNRTGTATALTYSQAGANGTAVSFNGTTSNVLTTNYPQGTSTLTISFKLKTSSTASGTILQCYNTSTNLSGYWIQYYSGYFTIMLANGTTSSDELSLSGTYNDNALHSFIFTYDGTTLNGYVDNVSRLSTTYGGSISYSGVTDLSFMSTDYGTGRISGTMDDFGFLNRVVTSGERATLVSSTHPF